MAALACAASMQVEMLTSRFGPDASLHLHVDRGRHVLGDGLQRALHDGRPWTKPMRFCPRRNPPYLTRKLWLGVFAPADWRLCGRSVHPDLLRSSMTVNRSQTTFMSGEKPPFLSK